MPRLNSGQEVWKSLDSVSVYRQVSGGGNTTLGAAVTAGATAANFAATTNFTSGDPLIISGASGVELNAITGLTPTTAVPLLYPVALANPSGAQLLEAVQTLLGHVEQGGAALDLQSPLAAVFSALGHTPITYLRGHGELTARIGLTGFNILNLQTMFGTTESEGGAGTSGDPYRAAIAGGSIGTQGIQCVRLTGTRVDGQNYIVDLNNAVIAPAGGFSLARGVPAVLPLDIRFSTVVVRQYT